MRQKNKKKSSDKLYFKILKLNKPTKGDNTLCSKPTDNIQMSQAIVLNSQMKKNTKNVCSDFTENRGMCARIVKSKFNQIRL